MSEGQNEPIEGQNEPQEKKRKKKKREKTHSKQSAQLAALSQKSRITAAVREKSSSRPQYEKRVHHVKRKK